MVRHIDLLFDLETLGFDKFRDRVVCASCRVVGSGVTYSFCGFDELTDLRLFFDKVKALNPTRVVSFNGYSFDIPFLWTKALEHNLLLPRCFVDKSMHLDLWYILTRRGKGKLSDFAQLLGQPSVGVGSDVPDLYKAGKISEIREHCESDLLVTESLFNRAKEVGLVG